MQAIILAAGMGKRLKELTRDNTKCMVKVNGVTLIERLLRILDRKNLSRIVIVVGYQGEKLIDYIDTLQINTNIVFVDNPIYNTTNNIYSLALAGDYLEKEDTLLFESDLIFEESIVDALLEDPRDTLAVVDKLESWMDGTCMVLDENDSIADFIPGKYVSYMDKEKYYKTVNIYKFSRHFSANTYVPFLEAYRKAKGENEYYESVIKLIAMLETDELKAMRLQGQVWYEIDDVQDLDIAETLFAENEKEKYAKITSRYGGYWRYPKLLDFCYLVNPYFPTTRMMEEMEANFDILVRNYPSGMAVNSLLAGRNFGVKKEHIVIGNGAAELIKALLEDSNFGKLGMIRPTFEEYPNRYETDRSVFYMPQNEDFRYTAEELMTYFDCTEIDALVLINPDNPSGNYISYSGLLKLIDWAKRKEIKLIIDESFADFADTTEKKTLIDEETLCSYDGLYVVKSISKSYGVPGIRLGVLASGNEQEIAKLKKSVAIWNINSVGEFFMQIYEKYEKDYLRSLEKIIESRKQLMEQLDRVPDLRTLPSQANYVMCEVIGGVDCEEMAAALLQNNILIKNLTFKINNGKQYIRLAVRTKEENDRLITELMKYMKSRNFVR